MSILIYLDKNGTIINNSSIYLPDSVILYNKNYPIAEIPKTVYQFRKWLQDEFYKMNEIQNIKRPKNPIIVNPTFAVKLLTFITFIYPIILLVYFLI